MNISSPAFDRIPRAALPALLKRMPKAELHMHIEGSLEPEMIFKLAQRNGVALKYPDVEALRRAYAFTDLQSFLDIYYAGASVLLKEQDFFDMAFAYLREGGCRPRGAHRDLLRPADAHRARRADRDRARRLERMRCGARTPSSASAGSLILCFLRHLSEEEAFETLEQALPYRHQFIGVGWTPANAATRRRSSRACSRAVASSACTWSPTPARRVRRRTSKRRSTC